VEKAPSAAIALSPADRLAKLRWAPPWLSLSTGLASAWWMDRDPDRAGPIAAATACGWALLAATILLRRLRPEGAGRRALLVRAARYSSLAGLQWVLQLSLFFTFPFYAHAADGLAHHGFLALLAVAAAATLWDPFFASLAARPAVGAVAGLATFAGLNAMLPILGASNLAGLALAAGAVVVGAPIAAAVAARPGARRRSAALAALAALALPAALAAGAVRLVPAAPLRLVEASVGTRRAGLAVDDPGDRFVAPAQLVCATTIWAPRGLSDALVHVWEKDGEVVDRIPLEVRGGREAGFRTFSAKRHLGAAPAGRWTCAVETAAGQRLGEREVTVEAPTPGACRSAPAAAAWAAWRTSR
jgi:hypothetical protein